MNHSGKNSNACSKGKRHRHFRAQSLKTKCKKKYLAGINPTQSPHNSSRAKTCLE